MTTIYLKCVLDFIAALCCLAMLAIAWRQKRMFDKCDGRLVEQMDDIERRLNRIRELCEPPESTP